MTPQERAAAVKHVVYMFGVPEFEVEGGEYENALAATVTLQRDTRRAALLEVAELHQEWRNGKHSGTFSDLLRHKLAQEG
jgi:hypothetical protein